MQSSVYGQNFYSSESRTASIASQIILPYVINKLKCKSVIDFGCGTGEWILSAKLCNTVKHVVGIDGEYAREYVNVKNDEFIAADLTQKIRFDHKYDLALSLEVAEHLPPECAKIFVSNLTACADIILFSAAIPCQHGTNHVNEQYPSYWQDIFLSFGFKLCDSIRPRFWYDKRIEWYYRQNIVIYCKERLYDEVCSVFNIEKFDVVDYIHPDAWEERNNRQYLFPFDSVEKNESICIYGGGVVGQTFINQLLMLKYSEKIYWCDQNAKRVNPIGGVICEHPDSIDMKNVDKIVIGILHQHIAQNIKDYLLAREVNESKIIWRNPQYHLNIM